MDLWPEVKIVFLRTPGILAALTRWITRCPANHVYLEVPLWGRQVVCEAATDGGVRMIAQPQRGDVVAIYGCRFDTHEGLHALTPLLGRSYDFWGTIPIAVAKLAWRWFRIRLRHWCWSTRAIKCSELIVLFLQACRIPVSTVSAEMAAPSDVLWWCKMQLGWFSLVQGSRAFDAWERRP